MGCTRQSMHHVAIQRSDILRARFMAEISKYDLATLIWLDDTGCNRRHTKGSMIIVFDHYVIIAYL